MSMVLRIFDLIKAESEPANLRKSCTGLSDVAQSLNHGDTETLSFLIKVSLSVGVVNSQFWTLKNADCEACRFSFFLSVFIIPSGDSVSTAVQAEAISLCMVAPLFPVHISLVLAPEIL